VLRRGYEALAQVKRRNKFETSQERAKRPKKLLPPKKGVGVKFPVGEKFSRGKNEGGDWN